MRGKLEIWRGADRVWAQYVTPHGGLPISANGTTVEEALEQLQNWCAVFGHSIPIEQVA